MFGLLIEEAASKSYTKKEAITNETPDLYERGGRICFGKPISGANPSSLRTTPINTCRFLVSF